MTKGKMTFGVIVGNRGFFPGHLAQSGRTEMIARSRKGRPPSNRGQDPKRPVTARSNRSPKRSSAPICSKSTPPTSTASSSRCPISATSAPSPIRCAWPGLNVPVLIQATPDTPAQMSIAHRRDSFCGKMSACNNLTQYGIPYSLTTLHTEAPDSDGFRKGSGLVRRRLPRGARPAPPAHRRHRRASRRLQYRSLQRETSRGQRHLRRDPSTFPKSSAASPRMKDDDPAAQAKLAAIQPICLHRRRSRRSAAEDGQAGRGDRRLDGANRGRHQRHSMLDLARRILRRGALHGDEHDERQPHVERLRSGYLRRGRHARLAAGLGNAQRAARLEQQLRRRSRQSGLLPLQQPAQAFLQAMCAWISRQIIAGTVGRENTYGTCVGVVKAGPMSFARFSTDDQHGGIHGYVGEGEFTDDPLNTFGGAGVVRIPQPARLAALYLRARLRAPCGRQPVLRVGERSGRQPRGTSDGRYISMCRTCLACPLHFYEHRSRSRLRNLQRRGYPHGASRRLSGENPFAGFFSMSIVAGIIGNCPQTNAVNTDRKYGGLICVHPWLNCVL